MIELIGLNKVYSPKGGEAALRDVDLRIEDGAIYGIIGPSGAGKSTLVRCINLLEKPTSGRVIVDGEDLTSLKKRRLVGVRRRIGMIFQGFHLLEQRTAAENVRFPLELIRMRRAEANRRARELLTLVGLADKSEAYPSELSGGQKQRVAIARALATKPKYLLCDEATSALDSNATASVLGLIRKVNQELGVTVVFITHEIAAAKSVCTDVAILDRGRLVESGKTEEIFSFPRSQIAKELILPGLTRALSTGRGDKFRLVFRGESFERPILQLLSECGEARILYSDVEEREEGVYGQMVVAAAEGSGPAFRESLSLRHIPFRKEVSSNA